MQSKLSYLIFRFIYHPSLYHDVNYSCLAFSLQVFASTGRYLFNRPILIHSIITYSSLRPYFLLKASQGPSRH